MKKWQGYRVALLFIVMAWLPVTVFAGERSLDTSNLPSIGLPSQPDDSVAKARDAQEKARLKKEKEAMAAELKAAKEESARLKKKMETAVPAPSPKLQTSGVPDPVSVGASTPSRGTTSTDPTTGMEFVYVKGGCFQMGDTFGDSDKDVPEKPVHEVCVDDFWLGKYEVTQGEWEKVMGRNPSMYQNGPRYPVERVSWDDIQKFIEKLNSQSRKAYRLPTEAEWEYAAREGGKRVRFGTGKKTIGPDEANFRGFKSFKEPYSRAGVDREKTTPVGTFPPNLLGLYDMSGNVEEWCSDWAGEEYTTSRRDNPRGPLEGNHRIVRGGSYDDQPFAVRATHRSRRIQSLGNAAQGFRLLFPAIP